MHAIVQKDHLIARWSFDEGNGTIVQNSVTGGSPLFMNLGNWGEEEDGNALSKYSMDISEGTGFAVLKETENFKSLSYSILLWFKTNGLPDDYAQLLSKRESTNYSYLFQIKPGGTNGSYVSLKGFRANMVRLALSIFRSISGIVSFLPMTEPTFVHLSMEKTLESWSFQKPH